MIKEHVHFSCKDCPWCVQMMLTTSLIKYKSFCFHRQFPRQLEQQLRQMVSGCRMQADLNLP